MANVIGEIKIVFDEDAKALLQEFCKSVNYLMDKDVSCEVRGIDDRKMAEVIEKMTKNDG